MVDILEKPRTATTAVSQRKGFILQGRVVDGTLTPPIEKGAVVTEGELIAWVGQLEALPQKFRTGYEVIALPGRTIMPGIIDGHTHIAFGEARSEEELALYTPVEFRALRAIWNARKICRPGLPAHSMRRRRTMLLNRSAMRSTAACFRDRGTPFLADN